MLHRHLPHLHHHHHGLGPPNHVLQIKGQIPILLHSEMAPITGEKLEVQVGGKFAFAEFCLQILEEEKIGIIFLEFCPLFFQNVLV